MSNTKVDLKVILLGHKAVGKTSMFNRYVYDEFGKTAMVCRIEWFVVVCCPAIQFDLSDQIDNRCIFCNETMQDRRKQSLQPRNLGYRRRRKVR
mmetsp:Transcript_20735/g.34028  ORF Transcript_20735/g.34028 Transcript_20735/m.34028 type:complete len:94 (-) Transcript_20735:612-893(-)